MLKIKYTFYKYIKCNLEWKEELLKRQTINKTHIKNHCKLPTYAIVTREVDVLEHTQYVGKIWCQRGFTSNIVL